MTYQEIFQRILAEKTLEAAETAERMYGSLNGVSFAYGDVFNDSVIAAYVEWKRLEEKEPTIRLSEDNLVERVFACACEPGFKCKLHGEEKKEEFDPSDYWCTYHGNNLEQHPSKTDVCVFVTGFPTGKKEECVYKSDDCNGCSSLIKKTPEKEEPRWRAKRYSEYACIDFFKWRIIWKQERATRVDISRHENGNYFPTREKAEEALEKIKQVLKA